MNGRTSTILTALVVAALIAIGVAYLIANSGSPEEETPASPEVALSSPEARQTGENGNRDPFSGVSGTVTDTTPSIAPSAPAQSQSLELQGKVAPEPAVSGVSTSAPTGAAEWMLAGLVGLIAAGGWNLIRLQQTS